MKLLIFTEHKDTLDYLVNKLVSWGLSVTQIHGGLKVGDRDTPNSRINAELQFREESQVMVATEAAGEGINLQFCWLMINYDIPWNPVRLEQRMGRIHRYGQEKDCLIFNFVAINTREGRVLQKLFERIKKIEDDLDPERTGKDFNVVGGIFPSNQLERMLRDMYAHNLTLDAIQDRIVKEIDPEHFRKITHSTLEGLAKKELNLSAIIGKSEETKERRLVPEVIEDFFLQAAPLAGITPSAQRKAQHLYRIGKIPRLLWPVGEELEPRFGKLGREYKQITFDKESLMIDPTIEWVTPGHPLFEAVREYAMGQVKADLQNGAVFYDLHSAKPYRLDVFSSAIRDGRGSILHRRLFIMQTDINNIISVRQPTIFLDLVPASKRTVAPDGINLPGLDIVEQSLLIKALNPFLAETSTRRSKEIAIITRHLEISLNELIHRQNMRMAELLEAQQKGDNNTLLNANIKTVEDRLYELQGRLEKRQEELLKEKNCSIADIQHHGQAWVLPHPERETPDIAQVVRDEEIEKIAVNKAMEYERSRGWLPESVETENRGFDLVSRRPHPEDLQTAVEARFIEVKGRSKVGQVALTANEFKTAERLKKDYWLYVVFNCASNPEIYTIQNPARLGWTPLVKVEHYYLEAKMILEQKDNSS